MIAHHFDQHEDEHAITFGFANNEAGDEEYFLVQLPGASASVNPNPSDIYVEHNSQANSQYGHLTSVRFSSEPPQVSFEFDDSSRLDQVVIDLERPSVDVVRIALLTQPLLSGLVSG